VANPIEDTNNPEFVGNQSKFKYLAIHGYEKFQRDKNGSLGDGSRLWIKDACRKDSDHEYSSLTVTQRYVLDGMRRLTGLHGKWPNNDPLWVVRGLCVGRKERGPCAKAVRTLVELGLVTLSNEQLGSLEVVEKTTNSTVQSGTERSDHTDEDLEAESKAAPKAKPSVPKFEARSPSSQLCSLRRTRHMRRRNSLIRCLSNGCSTSSRR
jgi:hypothetical protein